MTEPKTSKPKTENLSFFELIWPYVEKLLWIIAAIYSHLAYDLRPNSLIENQNLKKLPFLMGSIGFSFCVLTFCCLWFYLSFIKKSDQDIADAFPQSIPIVTVTFIVSSVLFNYGLWGIFAWRTPIISFVNFMAIICGVTLIPGKTKNKQD